LAFAGLAYLLWPSGDAPNVIGAAVMAIAAVGWGIYSLLGRGVQDPLAETAANFVLATPLCVLAFAVAGATLVTPTGVVLAVVSGALTSGLGYALWYAVIPALGASRAAVSQLTVPIIAAAGGAVFLSEGLTLRFVIASVLVLGGVLLSLRKA
jgi:drug/metabolite transporter (DMT)-like permease